MESGRLVANFKKSSDGTIRMSSVGKYKLYEIRLTIEDLPEGVKTVTYLLHPSSKSDRIEIVPYGVNGFREDINAYGDFFVTVTAEGFRPRSNEWFAVAFATKLSDALKAGHPSHSRTQEVDEAIARLTSISADSLLTESRAIMSLPSVQEETTSSLRLRIFDGSRQLFRVPARFLITITDGHRKQQFRDYCSTNDISFNLPFFDNFGDNYSVLVWAEGYRQSGFIPVTVSNQYTRILDIMLIPVDPVFNFTNARFDAACAAYPFVGRGVDYATAVARYERLLSQQEKSLACLLNLCEAMSHIRLSQGTPLDYIKQLRWDAPYQPAQDRLFAWSDPALIDQVKISTKSHQFNAESNAGAFHAGATASWKQIQFGEANVQLTFYENDRKSVDGLDCVMLEVDFDYYQDVAAHVIFEVVPNAITHSLTSPADVYVLRWMAGQQGGIPEFAPLYTITS